VDPEAYNAALQAKMAKAGPEAKKSKKTEELSYDQIAFALKSQAKQAPVK